MDFANMELKGNTLIISEGGEPVEFISEKNATTEELDMFVKFREKFPEGKENYKLVNGEWVELTNEEKLALIKHIETLPTMEDYIIDIAFRQAAIEMGGVL